MRIIQINVRDLDSFIKKLAEYNYVVEYKSHVVLSDGSELINAIAKKNNKEHFVFIVHYIAEHYLNKPSEVSEVVETTSDRQYINEWRIPVNPVIAIVLNNEAMNILTSYRDNYPVSGGEELVINYRNRNPNYRDAPKLMLARILEELSGED